MRQSFLLGSCCCFHLHTQTQPPSNLSLYLALFLSLNLCLTHTLWSSFHLLLLRISTHFMLRRVSCAGAVDIFMSLLGTFHPHKYYSWSRSLFSAASTPVAAPALAPSILLSFQIAQHGKFVTELNVPGTLGVEINGDDDDDDDDDDRDSMWRQNSKESIR